jgi:hypothetical protein
MAHVSHSADTKTKTYSKEDAYRRAVDRALNAGWVVQSTNIKDHGGPGPLGMLKSLVLGSKQYEVTFVRSGTAADPDPAVETGNLPPPRPRV